MAISATHYELLKSIRHILPHGGSLLEIGEAEWYGDIPPPNDAKTAHGVVRELYRELFDPCRIVSIDLHGTADAVRCNLNSPLTPKDTGDQFDLIYNHGTAEHIFNIAQVFRTMHDHCIDGGVMIHESPFTGWVDHGFYCLQPTLFYDLARANNYEIIIVAIEEIASRTIIRLNSREHVYQLADRGEIPNNSMLYVAYRKITDRPFAIPMQGVYGNGLSAAGRKAWEELR